MDKIKKDINLREAVSRREQKLPPLPSDLNERLLQRIQEEETTPKRRLLPLVLRWMSAAAAVLVAVVTLFTWKNHTLEPELSNVGQKAEVVVAQSQNAPLENQPSAIEKPDVHNEPTKHVKLANEAREVKQLGEPSSKTPQQAVLAEAKPATETPVLADAADSLYYYLTQLENQMGECRDSTCLAELGNLMRADERIKGLVNKIIHKQVETAYQEEYLVDTTTRYIPL